MVDSSLELSLQRAVEHLLHTWIYLFVVDKKCDFYKELISDVIDIILTIMIIKS